ncbi:TPA: hypothetical protein SMN02_002096 [Proteus mirabilis]|nr:hypothetical protein [Proteus mirabilis]
MKMINKVLIIITLLSLSINTQALMERTLVITAKYESYVACVAAKENIEFDNVYLLMHNNRNKVNSEGDQIPLSFNPRFDTELLQHYHLIYELTKDERMVDCDMFASIIYDSLKDEFDVCDMGEYSPMDKNYEDVVLSLLK